MARVNTNTIDGIAAASKPKAAPVVDTRIALRKLQSGQQLTDDEATSLGFPVAETTPVTPVTSTITPPPADTPTWVKASTVNTANGPVDVDVNGLAADGSKPVAVVAGSESTGVPAGFTAGPFPKELEQFFGSSAGVIGYRIITNPDGSQQLEVSDTPGSSKTFGFKFGRDESGKYVQFKSSGGSTVGSGGATLKTATQLAAEEKAAAGRADRQSAYDLLYSQFKLYGLESLVEPLKGLITSGASPSEFTIKLRESDAYKKRFSANAQRIAKGLSSL